MIKVLLLDADTSGCGVYRSILPARHITEYLKSRDIELIHQGSIEWKDIEDFDVMICNRFFNLSSSMVIYEYKKSGKILLWNWDDNFSAVTEIGSHPLKHALNEVILYSQNLFLDWSDRLLVSTPALKEAFQRQQKTLIFENLVDLAMWAPLPKQSNINAKVNRQKTICYHGSNTHKTEIDMVKGALLELLDKHDDLVVYFLTDAPEELKNHNRVWRFDFVDTSLFPRFLQLVRPDVCLLPLADNGLNICKSNIKWLESTLAGAVCVASNYGPYKNLPVEYADTQEGWVKTIELLLDTDFQHASGGIATGNPSRERPSAARRNWNQSMAEITMRWSWQSPAGQAFAERFGDMIEELVPVEKRRVKSIKPIKPMFFKESEIAHKWLDPFGDEPGIELGGSAHNPFTFPNIKNLDYTDDMTTVFKLEEIKLCGQAKKVDIVADAAHIPVPDSSFSYLISSHVLEHMPDVIRSLIEWHRVVRPDGIIFTIVPHRDALESDKDRDVTTLDHFKYDYLKVFEEVDDHHHYHVFTLELLLELVDYINDPDDLDEDNEYLPYFEVLETQEKDDKVGNGSTLVLKVVK